MVQTLIIIVVEVFELEQAMRASHALGSITIVANRRARALAAARRTPEPRTSTAVEFFLFFGDEKSAHAAAAELKPLGYSVSARHVSSSDRWLVLAERQMAPSGAAALEGELREIATRHHGDYDGWSVAAS